MSGSTDESVAISSAGAFHGALAYEQTMGRWSRVLAGRVADVFDIPNAGDFLDVGCGTGAMSATLQAGSECTRVIGIDRSPSFVAYAHGMMASPRASFAVGDAEMLPFADNAFDHSVSCLVLMLVADPERIVSEMCRVTQADGVVLACTWQDAGMEAVELVLEEAARLDPMLEKHLPRPTQCNREGDLARLWASQGLRAVAEERVTVSTPFKSFDDYWLPFAAATGTRIAAYISQLPSEHAEALQAALRLRLGGGRGFVLRASALAVRGINSK